MKNLVTLLFVLFCTITLFPQNTISDLRQNNANGEPEGLGQMFTVSGVVTASSQFGGYGPAYIQDGIAGVAVYGNGFANEVAIGDSVTVTAELTQYRGLTELDMGASGASYSLISSENELTPRVVTIEEVLNQQWDGFEALEGLFVRINNVSFETSGSFAGGTNYTITDATGSMDLRIDDNVIDIVGAAIPSDEIDIVGVLGQYKYGIPYNNGYQIFPRFMDDIITKGEPYITGQVYASNVTSSSFTAFFQTQNDGDTEIRWGTTEALESGALRNEDYVTDHQITVGELEPATRYYYKVFSTNAEGTSESEITSVTTLSENPETGAFNVYFNFSVDTTVAIPGNAAKGNMDFSALLTNRINAATHSIDMAVYSFFELSNVINALINAKDRGVKVRVVYDSRDDQSGITSLRNAGIQVQKRNNSYAIMHNKFFVFDARDTIAANDWIWTGSWNVTSLEMGWKNNVIEINDPAIAQAYLIEFEEMWGSDGDNPDNTNADFGGAKANNTQHLFTIGDKEVELYFSPSDGTTSEIVSEILDADQSIYFAQFVFTKDEIADAMKTRYSSGISDIRGLIVEANSQGSEYNTLNAFAEMYKYTYGDNLHHKYGMIDVSYPEDDPVVITGSHNWSAAAENDNDENTLIIHDIYVANQYMQEFKARYNEAGGRGTFVIPVISDVKNPVFTEYDFQVYQNYPNPFNPSTTVRLEVPTRDHVTVELYDILGQQISVLFDQVTGPGIIAIDVDLRAIDSSLTSGTYIYLVKAGAFMRSKKMIFLK